MRGMILSPLVEPFLRHLDKSPLKVDANGHFCSGLPERRKALSERILALNVLKVLRLLTEEEMQDVMDGKTFEAITIRMGYEFEWCGECGEKLVCTFDGETFYLEGAPCSCPDGMQPFTFEIDIPSGKMVVANDLRGFFPQAEEDPTSPLYDMMTNLGLRALSHAYAKHGLAYGYVGNTCPNLVEVAPGRYAWGVSALA